MFQAVSLLERLERIMLRVQALEPDRLNFPSSTQSEGSSSKPSEP